MSRGEEAKGHRANSEDAVHNRGSLRGKRRKEGRRRWVSGVEKPGLSNLWHKLRWVITRS